MKKIRAYLILVGLVLFIAYFGVYGFYAGLAEQIGVGWALAGAISIGLGAAVIAIVGAVMIESRPPETDERPPSD